VVKEVYSHRVVFNKAKHLYNYLSYRTQTCIKKAAMLKVAAAMLFNVGGTCAIT
jgi:hypothetical protein